MAYEQAYRRRDTRSIGETTDWPRRVARRRSARTQPSNWKNAGRDLVVDDPCFRGRWHHRSRSRANGSEATSHARLIPARYVARAKPTHTSIRRDAAWLSVRSAVSTDPANGLPTRRAGAMSVARYRSQAVAAGYPTQAYKSDHVHVVPLVPVAVQILEHTLANYAGRQATSYSAAPTV